MSGQSGLGASFPTSIVHGADVDGGQEYAAARLLEWLADRHGCTGPGCGERGHARDYVALGTVLDALGLLGSEALRGEWQRRRLKPA